MPVQADLDAEQFAAVTAPIDKPLVIKAGYLLIFSYLTHRSIQDFLCHYCMSNLLIYLYLTGPGSGKTCAIANRVIHIINNTPNATGILCLTFSRNASIEMKERIIALLDNDSKVLPPHIACNTFHSFGLKLSKKFYTFLNYSAVSTYSLTYLLTYSLTYLLTH